MLRVRSVQGHAVGNLLGIFLPALLHMHTFGTNNSTNFQIRSIKYDLVKPSDRVGALLWSPLLVYNVSWPTNKTATIQEACRQFWSVALSISRMISCTYGSSGGVDTIR